MITPKNIPASIKRLAQLVAAFGCLVATVGFLSTMWKIDDGNTGAALAVGGLYAAIVIPCCLVLSACDDAEE